MLSLEVTIVEMRRRITVLVSNVIILLVLGTIAYHNIEGWSLVDSFYFTSITLTTIGYGDLHPTTTAAKLFTVLFAFSGIGIMLYSLTLIASEIFSKRPIIEPKQIMTKSIRFLAREILKEEEERLKYKIQKKLTRKPKQKYKYKPKKKKK